MRKEVVQSLAEPVGNFWKEQQNSSVGEFFVSAPLSSTPLPIYKWIVEHSAEFGEWENVRFVLMDEMLEGESYVPVTDPASYEGFARKHFLGPLEEATGIEIPVVKPESDKIEKFNTEIDLLILALGVKGNYANVMPGTDQNAGWHVAELLPEFRQYHEQAGYSGSKFGEHGMSLGPKQVREARKVVVIISGEKKRELVAELFAHDSFDSQFPLSIIYHPDVKDKVEIFITEDAV